MPEDKRLFELGFANALANRIQAAIQPACYKIFVAGSIRREKPQVHDVDLVVWPRFEPIYTTNLFGEQNKTGSHIKPLRAILKSSEHVKNLRIGDKIIRFDFHELPVELYLTEEDGSNFGALVQMRTGSEEFNRGLATRAKERRLSYRAGYGVFDLQGKRLDDDTEEGIFKWCGVQYVDPQRR